MISIKQLDEAIDAYSYDTNINYNDLIDDCEKFLKFLEIPYNSFTEVTVLQLTRFLLDDTSVKKLNTKLNNKAFW